MKELINIMIEKDMGELNIMVFVPFIIFIILG